MLSGQYVDVHHEPYHQVKQERKGKLRLLEIKAQPGDTCAMHVHRSNLCYLTLQGTKVWLNELGKSPRTVNLPTGYVNSHADYDVNPFTHQFANVGENDFHLFAVEDLNEAPPIGSDFLSLKGKIHSSDAFVVSRIVIKPKESFHFSSPMHGAAILEKGQKALGVRSLKRIKLSQKKRWSLVRPGAYRFKNKSEEEIHLVFILVK